MGYIGNERADPYNLKLKKGKFSKIMVICVTIALLIFTGAVFLTALLGAYIPDALIYCFFGAALGEYWALAFVKKTKTEMGEQYAIYRTEGVEPVPGESGGEAGEAEQPEANSADEKQSAGVRV